MIYLIEQFVVAVIMYQIINFVLLYLQSRGRINYKTLRWGMVAS
jgi:hypothetical protein